MTYSTNFKLTAPVIDVEAAREYLTSDDMTVFLKQDRRTADVSEHVAHIEWQLDDEISGRIILYTSAELTEEELAVISDWVSGQNSDGLGEGFEQQNFANYRDDDYYDDDEESYDDEWVMASFDWQTNDYIFTKVS